MTDGTGLVTDTYVYDAWVGGLPIGSREPRNTLPKGVEASDRHQGNMVSQTGSTLQPFKYVGRYGYYAHYQDDAVMPYPVVTGSSSSGIPGNTALSFIQTGVRTYFPRLGRYMQVDPARHGINWVMYSNDNPVNAIDPSGLKYGYSFWVQMGGDILSGFWGQFRIVWTSFMLGFALWDIYDYYKCEKDYEEYLYFISDKINECDYTAKVLANPCSEILNSALGFGYNIGFSWILSIRVPAAL